MRHALAIGLVSTLVIVAACGGGGSSAPTSPSPSMGSPGSPTIGATVTGTINLASTSRAEGVSGALDVSGFTVSVVGTGITASVSPNGQFTLTGVPSGDVQIRITGPGVDATLTLSGVQAGQTIEIRIKVSGNTATLDDDARQVAGQMEIEGRVEVAPLLPAAPTTMMVAGRTINILGTTVVRKGGSAYSLVNILVGMRVHVKGTANTTNPAAPSVDALEVMVQNENADLPSQYRYEGTIALPPTVGVEGTAAAFTVRLSDGRVIMGNSSTQFEGGTFAGLAPGVLIEARGVIMNPPTGSYLEASRIEIKGGSGAVPPAGTEFEGMVSGSAPTACPTPSFSLASKGRTYTVTTSASTVFEPACATMALKVGDRVEVQGTLTGTTIAATKVEKNMRK